MVFGCVHVVDETAKGPSHLRTFTTSINVDRFSGTAETNDNFK